MGNSSSKGPPIDEECLAPWGVYPELQWDKPTAKAVKKLILDREMAWHGFPYHGGGGWLPAGFCGLAVQ